MKKLILVLPLLFLGGEFNSQVRPEIVPDQNRKIQVAILFDASGSMDGLLNQAKARIWQIVNSLSEYTYRGTSPRVEIALYEYGRSSNDVGQNYVQLLTGFTTDLDLISSKLFSITTNGGEEYCGAVIQKAGMELAWSFQPNDLKMIYIAGNEPFNQGAIDYRIVIPNVLQKEIFVNTIYCGPYSVGVAQFWQNGAELGGGNYFSINSDQQIVVPTTPYDALINTYNDSLNQTYVGYGSQGVHKKSVQIKEDNNAESLSSQNKAERAIAKSKEVYKNETWDLVDGVRSGKVELSQIEEKDLPEDFKQLETEERLQKLKELEKQRSTVQKMIQTLSEQRKAYLLTLEKSSDAINDDFGSSVQKSIHDKALKLGYEYQGELNKKENN
jgi:hypothetical protein